MKKAIMPLLMVLAVAFTFTSCKKDKDKDNTKVPSSTETFIKYDGKTYKTKPVKQDEKTYLMAFEKGTLAFMFNKPAKVGQNAIGGFGEGDVTIAYSETELDLDFESLLDDVGLEELSIDDLLAAIDGETDPDKIQEIIEDLIGGQIEDLEAKIEEIVSKIEAIDFESILTTLYTEPTTDNNQLNIVDAADKRVMNLPDIQLSKNALLGGSGTTKTISANIVVDK